MPIYQIVVASMGKEEEKKIHQVYFSDQLGHMESSKYASGRSPSQWKHTWAVTKALHFQLTTLHLSLVTHKHNCACVKEMNIFTASWHFGFVSSADGICGIIKTSSAFHSH